MMTLLTEVTKYIEDALWNGVRAIEESELMLRHMGQHLQELNQTEVAQRFLEKAEKAKLQAKTIREVASDNEVINLDTIDRDYRRDHPL